jgi:glutamate racemase
MNTKQDYIAVFDSGLGGLSVLRHLRRRMPGERFLYYGDSAHAPYGVRSREEVEALTLDAAEYLMCRGLKALVVACNTATSAAIDTLRTKYPDLIVVGVEPALKLAADHFPGGKIGVMATPVTLREEKFCRLLDRCASQCCVYRIPAPQLVPLVEEGKVDTALMEQTLHTLLDPYAKKMDALVLGCTHFPFASHAMERLLGPKVAVLDGGDGTARETLHRLQAADLLECGAGQLVLENSLGTQEILRRSRRMLGLDA